MRLANCASSPIASLAAAARYALAGERALLKSKLRRSKGWKKNVVSRQKFLVHLFIKRCEKDDFLQKVAKKKVVRPLTLDVRQKKRCVTQQTYSNKFAG